MLSKRAASTKSATHFGGSSKTGRLFVISASSGTGKTTLARELLKEDKNLVASVSCTTRPPRPKELNGVDYYFVTKKEFLEKKRKKRFFRMGKCIRPILRHPEKRGWGAPAAWEGRAPID